MGPRSNVNLLLIQANWKIACPLRKLHLVRHRLLPTAGKSEGMHTVTANLWLHATQPLLKLTKPSSSSITFPLVQIMLHYFKSPLPQLLLRQIYVYTIKTTKTKKLVLALTNYAFHLHHECKLLRQAALQLTVKSDQRSCSKIGESQQQ